MNHAGLIRAPFDLDGQSAAALGAPGEVEREGSLRMAGQHGAAKTALQAYKIKADAAEDAARKSRTPTNQPINWAGLSNALGPIASAVFNRGGGAASDDPITTAFRQPSAWAGGGFSAPDYWSGAQAMDAQKVFGTGWNIPSLM